MKVLHCITRLSDAGGAEKLLQDLVPELRRRDVETDVAVLNGHASENRKFLKKNGVRVYDLSHNTHYYNPLRVFKLLRIARSYDIVHAHNTPAVVLTSLASFFYKRPVVMTLHSTADRLRDSKWTRWIACAIENRFDSIVCCSAAAERALRRAMTLRHPRILTVNNGVNIKRFMEALPQKQMADMACRKITMVAGFRAPKDQRCVIESLRYLPASFHVFLVGDGVTKPSCVALAERLGLQGRVHFTGLRHDVPEILKASDYIVLASHYEGLSLSSVEGMASGKPFVGSDVPGIREVVEGAGLLFPDGDARALAGAIMSLDRDETRRNAVVERCRQRAVQYDISAMADGYRKVYLSLMNGR